MPSTLLHLAFAQEVYQQAFSLSKFQYLNKFHFFCGNLIPDETSNKLLSHYRVPYGITRFFVPDLKEAQKDLLSKKNSLNIGMYCHLYLDYHFITDFLVPEFIWDYQQMQVINPRNNKVWEANIFFSKDGFYSAYSELNQLLIENNIVDINDVNKLPSILPKTGIEYFDDRREKTWKEELNEYLEKDIKYIGDILDYNKVVCFLKQTAATFITIETIP
jgi:hypothetical protein